MCNQCKTLIINGMLCHEIGCPDSWKGHKIDCKWCGNEFIPDDSGQEFCDPECCNSYYC